MQNPLTSNRYSTIFFFVYIIELCLLIIFRASFEKGLHYIILTFLFCSFIILFLKYLRLRRTQDNETDLENQEPLNGRNRRNLTNQNHLWNTFVVPRYFPENETNQRYRSAMIRLSAMNEDFDEADYGRLLLLDNFVPQKSLNENQIERFPTKKYKPRQLDVEADLNENEEQQTKEKCMICLECYKNDETLLTLPCFHDFHQSCISKWLKIKAICPVCNQEVSVQQQL
ncbi:hypothetical protein M0812_12770 [Anaeramoeba flamelloides]|uniref:RING-type E3 ubiquitin transferase n=1 Tax=Anaeramoeba flamelloides TaxID=1746091 RepID=A0AAV7ZRM8_9EUKA|nr:hypothetical protein M0812_12770 [Anaeramoeba flamelloides]